MSKRLGAIEHERGFMMLLPDWREGFWLMLEAGRYQLIQSISASLYY